MQTTILVLAVASVGLCGEATKSVNKNEKRGLLDIGSHGGFGGGSISIGDGGYGGGHGGGFDGGLGGGHGGLGGGKRMKRTIYMYPIS